MIINTENYMIMIFSYSNADDKVKISKFRDGKYYMHSIEIQNNNVSDFACKNYAENVLGKRIVDRDDVIMFEE